MTKLRCKDYYNLFQEGKPTEPTAVKRWSSFFPYFVTFNTIYKSTKDIKLREFGYKILHRVLVTKKELEKFRIRNDDLCDQCKTPDSLQHTFYNVLQMLNSIMKSFHGLMYPTILLLIFPLSKF